MVRLIMGNKGSGKTKKMIEKINAAATEEKGSVVCIEAKSSMTFDIHHHVRLVSAAEYNITSYEAMRGFLSGMYASNYDIAQVFIDNLFKIVGGDCTPETEKFLDWMDRFSEKYGVNFTVSMSCDPSVATEGMKKYL